MFDAWAYYESCLQVSSDQNPGSGFHCLSYCAISICPPHPWPGLIVLDVEIVRESPHQKSGVFASCRELYYPTNIYIYIIYIYIQIVISCCKDPVLNQSGFNGMSWGLLFPLLKCWSMLKHRDWRTIPFIRFMTITLPETEVKRDLIANTRGEYCPVIFTPPKFTIDIQTRHIWKEIKLPNHHAWYLC